MKAMRIMVEFYTAVLRFLYERDSKSLQMQASKLRHDRIELAVSVLRLALQVTSCMMCVSQEWYDEEPDEVAASMTVVTK